MKIEYIKIYKLHGESDFEIPVVNNALILVAENGSGKTTIVNMLFYFLSRQWKKLNDYDFQKMIVKINGRQLVFEKNNYKRVMLRESRMSKRFPSKYIEIAEEILVNYNLTKLRHTPEMLERLSTLYNVPLGLLHEIIFLYADEEFRLEKDTQILKLEEQIDELLKGIQIVYLPTYRRIEKDLRSIFPDLEEQMKEYEYMRKRKKTREKEIKSYLELVEFGMEDVKEKIDKMCSTLKYNFYNNLSKSTGSYLEDILNKKYITFDVTKANFDQEALTYLITRLDENFISANGKIELEKFVKNVNRSGYINIEDKINAYFVLKLFQVYELQKSAERKIVDFIEVINDYISNGKRFSYDDVNFKVDIFLDREIKGKDLFRDQENPTISLTDLSSGEKQIVSLFSHLLLAEGEYFVIIDEPELSLSVPWQERFLLDIAESRGCTGFLAVTHSPFIFRNKLKPFAHSLEEFKV